MYHLAAVPQHRRTRYSGTHNLKGGRVLITYPGSSGRYRNAVRASLNGLGCACRSRGLAGVGDSGQVQTAAQYASLGAKAGSVVPGIGTVIGGAVGAIYGAIKGKKKPVRPTSQDKANCTRIVSEYEALIAPYPNQPIGGALPEESIKAVWMCYEMVVLGTTKDPRYLEGNWLVAKDAAIEAVTKTFTTPAGTDITLSTEGRRDRDGKLFRPAKVSWANGEANTMSLIGSKVQQYFMAGCLAYNKAPTCDAIHNRATFKHLIMDLVAWAAATQIPQVEIPPDPDTALPGAPTAPAAPPAPVVAVSTAPFPVLTVPAPTQLQPVPAVPTPQLPGSVSPVPAAPGAPAGAYELQLAAQLQPMINQLLAQGADQKYAFTSAISSLAQRGIEPTAAVQSAVADAVSGSSSGMNPWILVGGGLAAAVLIFALAGKRA